MSFSLGLAVRGDLQKYMRDNAHAIRLANREAVTDATHSIRDDLRADMRRAGLGKLEKTWRAEIFPANGLADNPAGYIYSRAEYLVESFSSGRPIKARNGQYLAVPIPGSPAERLRDPRGPATKVDAARERFGDLVFIPGVRGGRPPMIAAENVGFTRTGNLTRRSRTKTGRHRAGAATVPLFFLVPEVRLGRRLNTARIAQRGERRFEARLDHALNRRLRRVAEGQT